MQQSLTDNNKRNNKADAARHICEEVRVLLTSLRGGPPNVAHGALSRDLYLLRNNVRSQFLDTRRSSSPTNPDKSTQKNNDSNSNSEVELEKGASEDPPQDNDNQEKAQAPTEKIPLKEVNMMRQYSISDTIVGPFARPFLDVVMDPLAAGPHTLVALRALHRLLERGSLVPSLKEEYYVNLDPLMVGVLRCKFEQTDVGADEAVEMAIADLLALIVSLDNSSSPENKIKPETFMDAFNTVFVTRNTFVHSPALCYHFEEVLNSMVVSAFGTSWGTTNNNQISTEDQIPTAPSQRTVSAIQLVFEFICQQLLYTPRFNASENIHGSGGSEAQAAHDATRILCLRLSRHCIRAGWSPLNGDGKYRLGENKWEEESVLRIIRDEFCLSLLMLGQAFWLSAPNETMVDKSINPNNENFSSGGSVGLPLEVLAEVCSTISVLWNISSLRTRLVIQFESIFTGFFQRTLLLLRKRPVPEDSSTFMTNVAFDAGAEIILETLLDILCLHDSAGTTLETLFTTYDCNICRSDVTKGLIIELCRCCGGEIRMGEYDVSLVNSSSNLTDQQQQEISIRQAPPHLKGLCGEALIGSLKYVFRRTPGFPSVSENVDEVPTETETETETNNKSKLREIKNKKRIMHRGALMFNKRPKEGIQFLKGENVLNQTPKDIAKFLRQGVVVGLDKVAIGSYLGDAGKAPAPNKNFHDCERDWFHKEVLVEYCALFHFENQTLLDGLRMFLTSFRLPGEAQQIDRILQAFAESCGIQCEEGKRHRMFSEDPKRAADAAYLLAFSIIMLNTDLHNDNIRPDRKMTKNDFVKNNTNYGSDITEKGKDLPREFLEAIYDSIKEEQIRTEGEGADGVMTVERWKDVLRGQSNKLTDFAEETDVLPLSEEESLSTDLKDLIIESLWEPIVSSIGGFWGVNIGGSGMIGSQGTRLGVDLSMELLNGVRGIGRLDLFREIFIRVCRFSGLLEYKQNAVDRLASFVYSVERQGAVIVAINIAKEAGDDIGVQGWKSVWSIIFELRDLKLLDGNKTGSLLSETDPDLLNQNTRILFGRKLVEQSEKLTPSIDDMEISSVVGTMSRLFFGDAISEESPRASKTSEIFSEKTLHGKEKLVLWDDIDPIEETEEEEEEKSKGEEYSEDSYAIIGNGEGGPSSNNSSIFSSFSTGEAFENMLLNEDHDVPNLGTESSEMIRTSQRERVRKRLVQSCDFGSLVSESRYLSLEGIQFLLQALIELIKVNRINYFHFRKMVSSKEEYIPLSPASEAFAEVLICEVAIKNRDRISFIWDVLLSDHYLSRLGEQPITQSDEEKEIGKRILHSIGCPGDEKCATGLLRVCRWMINREDVSNKIICSLRVLYPSKCKNSFVFSEMGKQLGEGLWRICQNIDGVSSAKVDGWESILGLIHWCGSLGGNAIRVGLRKGGLEEDDPSLQSFRSLHLMLHEEELGNSIPFGVVDCITLLVERGEKGNCSKLVNASLDLLFVFHRRLELTMDMLQKDTHFKSIWVNSWLATLKGISRTASESSFRDVRQHALSMLMDTINDKHRRVVSKENILLIINDICIPLAAKRISELLRNSHSIKGAFWEETMIELELCVSLIFKPFLQNLSVLREDETSLLTTWKSLLDASALLLGDERPSDEVNDSNQASDDNMTIDKLLLTTKDLASERLKNAIIVLVSSGVLKESSSTQEESTLSLTTWNSIQQMKFCAANIEEWKLVASGSTTTDLVHTTSEKGKEINSNHIPDGGENTCESSG